MILASDSVDGQRGRPSEDSRFDLLKAVEIEARPLGEAGRRQRVTGGQRVDRRPDTVMREHRLLPLQEEKIPFFYNASVGRCPEKAALQRKSAICDAA